jgi:hypothetical protein
MTTFSHSGIPATSHTQTAPRVGHLRAHLGAYLVGVGATTALTAAALVGFLSMATFVAFNGFPFGGSSNDAGAAYLEPNGSAAPAATAAGAALGAARAAVARDPVPGSRAGGPGTGSGSRSGGDNSPGGNASGGGPSGGDASGGGAPGGGGGGVINPPPIEVPPPASGPVTNTVEGVGNATGADVSGTSGVTHAVDGAATGTGNNVGGAVGRSHLGDEVGGAVNRATDTVLGGGGGLLGG